MPRKDPTFTNEDLLRFYCKNLDPGEKYRVMEVFKGHIKNGIKICPDDPDKKIDPCEWIKFTKELVGFCAEKARLLVQIAQVLTMLEVALGALSWMPPYGKVLKIIVIVIGYVVAVLIFAATLMTLVGQLGGFMGMLDKYFCTGEKPLPLPKPPELDLPEDPQRRIDEIIDWIEGIFDWISPSDSDNIPPELLTGP